MWYACDIGRRPSQCSKGDEGLDNLRAHCFWSRDPGPVKERCGRNGLQRFWLQRLGLGQRGCKNRKEPPTQGTPSATSFLLEFGPRSQFSFCGLSKRVNSSPQQIALSSLEIKMQQQLSLTCQDEAFSSEGGGRPTCASHRAPFYLCPCPWDRHSVWPPPASLPSLRPQGPNISTKPSRGTILEHEDRLASRSWRPSLLMDLHSPVALPAGLTLLVPGHLVHAP